MPHITNQDHIKPNDTRVNDVLDRTKDAKALELEMKPLLSSVNRKLFELVRDTLRRRGFAMTHVKRSVGYYPASLDDAYSSFRIQWLPGWRFGLWLDAEALLDEKADETTPIIQLFVQHYLYIDKFKPSRSPLAVSVQKSQVLCVLDGSDAELAYVRRQLLSVPRCVRDHPFLTYAEAFDPEQPLEVRPIPYFLANVSRDLRTDLGDTARVSLWHAYAKHKAKELEADPNVETTHVSREWSREGPRSYPPVQLQVVLRQGLSQDEEEATVYRHLDAETFGHLAFGGEVLRVIVRAGSGEERGIYSFFE